MEIYDATADDLYMAVRDGIDFESNCYFDPNEQMSFNFAASPNFGEMGGLYTLSEWQSEHDWERDSVETDPQFSDADAADFTVNNANCADRGALSQGVSVSTDKVFRILCED